MSLLDKCFLIFKLFFQCILLLGKCSQRDRSKKFRFLIKTMRFSTLPVFNSANYFSGEYIPRVHIARKDSKLMLLVKQSKIKVVSLTSMHTWEYFRFILSQNFPCVLLIVLQFLLFYFCFQSLLSANSLLPVDDSSLSVFCF